MNRYLVAGGIMSGLFALLHVAIIIGGPEWYLFFGAGQEMADMAAKGSWYPPLLTLGVFVVLTTWSLYAWSGAGLIRRLPLLKTGLVAIASIYLLRGAVPFTLGVMGRQELDGLMIWSSLVCLLAGGAYVAGTRRIGPASPRDRTGPAKD